LTTHNQKYVKRLFTNISTLNESIDITNPEYDEESLYFSDPCKISSTIALSSTELEPFSGPVTLFPTVIDVSYLLKTKDLIDDEESWYFSDPNDSIISLSPVTSVSSHLSELIAENLNMDLSPSNKRSKTNHSFTAISSPSSTISSDIDYEVIDLTTKETFVNWNITCDCNTEITPSSASNTEITPSSASTENIDLQLQSISPMQSISPIVMPSNNHKIALGIPMEYLDDFDKDGYFIGNPISKGNSFVPHNIPIIKNVNGKLLRWSQRDHSNTSSLSSTSNENSPEESLLNEERDHSNISSASSTSDENSPEESLLNEEFHSTIGGTKLRKVKELLRYVQYEFNPPEIQLELYEAKKLLAKNLARICPSIDHKETGEFTCNIDDKDIQDMLQNTENFQEFYGISPDSIKELFHQTNGKIPYCLYKQVCDKVEIMSLKNEISLLKDKINFITDGIFHVLGSENKENL
jgi:hypothetical protein